MIVVQITHRIIPEHVDRYVEATIANANETRKEPGNIRFDVLRDPEDPACFVLYEVYTDKEAQQAHLASSHFAAWREAVSDVFAGRTIQKFEAVNIL